eukprot:scaffold25917_cov121-Isochrysis_galbana.AAC.4
MPQDCSTWYYNVVQVLVSAMAYMGTNTGIPEYPYGTFAPPRGRGLLPPQQAAWCVVETRPGPGTVALGG